MNKIITSLILLSLFASAENNVFKPTADQPKKPIIKVTGQPSAANFFSFNYSSAT